MLVRVTLVWLPGEPSIFSLHCERGFIHPLPPKPHEPLHTAGGLPPSTPALAEC